MDLIDRQAALEAIGRAVTKEVARWSVEDLPSTDLIRCKDCKFWVVHTLFDRSQGWCERLCDEFDKSLARGTEEDDFCSRAERRTDE